MNATTEASIVCDELINPWCGQLFGVQQVIEIIFLSIVSVMGTLGNLTIIFSIILQGVVQKNGNIFLINLAVADLLVTSICLPSIIPSVIVGRKGLPDAACSVVGYFVIVSSVCSLANMAAVAANRYWAIVRHSSYHRVFSKRNTWFVILGTWIWANIITIPAGTKAIGLVYDEYVLVCAWNVYSSHMYNIFLMGIAVFIPVSINVFFYYNLYVSVKRRGRWIRSICTSTVNALRKEQKSLQTEIDLLKTLATIVIVFVLCWIPHGIVILIGRPGPPAGFHKTFGWLALSNSSANFLIYGIMNPGYRKGYKQLLRFVFCHEIREKRSASIVDSSGNDRRFSKKPTPTSTPARNHIQKTINTIDILPA